MIGRKFLNLKMRKKKNGSPSERPQMGNEREWDGPEKSKRNKREKGDEWNYTRTEDGGRSSPRRRKNEKKGGSRRSL